MGIHPLSDKKLEEKKLKQLEKQTQSHASRKDSKQDLQEEESFHRRDLKDDDLSPSQTILLLHGKGQSYSLTHDYSVPVPKEDEILIRVDAIGLNPIDWKAP